MKKSNEALLFRHLFRYDRLGDHVDEIKFDCPVCITHVEVGESGPSSDQQPVLKVFALDLNALAGARFAPLCSSAISVPPSGSHTYRATEMVMTDHVVLRGRYSSIELSLWGACEHNVQMVRERMEIELGMSANELPDVTPSLPEDEDSAESGPYAWLPTSQSPIPSITTLAPAFAQALQSAVEYYRLVQAQGHSPAVIEAHPPQQRLKELMAAATLLENALQGEASKTQLATLSGGKPVDEELVAEYAEMAVTWTRLLTKKQRASMDELTLGLGGLACVNLLSSCRKTALQLLGKGVVSALMGVLSLRYASNAMLRMAVCALDVLTQATGVVGCHAILGWWSPLASKDKSHGDKADKENKRLKSRAANGSGGAAKHEGGKQNDTPVANGSVPDSNGSLRGGSAMKKEEAADVDMEGEPAGAEPMDTGGEGAEESESDDDEDSEGSQERATPPGQDKTSPGGTPVKKEAEKSPVANGGPGSKQAAGAKGDPASGGRPPRKGAPQSLVSVMSKLVRACMGRQAHNLVVQKVTRLLKRLQACQTAARFQEVSELLIKGHRPQVEMTLRETGQALRDLVGLIHTFTHLCSAESTVVNANPVTRALEATTGRWSLTAPTADPCVVEVLLSSRVLQLCAAVLHVPVMHNQHLWRSTQDGDTDGSGGAGGGRNRQVQLLQLQQLQQQLMGSMKGLLSALMSSRSGVLALSKGVPHLQALVKALDPLITPSFNPYATRQMRKGLPSELAHWLKYTTSGLQAVNTLEAAVPGGVECQGAAYVLLQLSGVAGGVEVASQLLALSGQGLPALLKLLQLRNKVLESTMDNEDEDPSKKRRSILPLDLVMDDVVEEEKSFAWESLYAPYILLNLVSQPHPDIIAAWLPAATEIADAVKAELDASAKYAGNQDDRVRRTLKEAQGYVQAAITFQDKGLGGLMELLDSTLPRSTSLPSSAAGAASTTAGAGKGKSAQGDNKAGFLLLRSPEKLSSLMGALHVLAALLKQSPVSKSWLAHEVYSSNGLGIMERALRCALLGMAASKSDAMWAMLGGDSTDDMERGRYRVLSSQLMRATCACLAEFIWRLESVTTSNGRLLQAVLAAHTAVCMSTENLAASVLPAEQHTPLLQARQALIVTLLSWMEHEWKPEVVGSILGVKHQYRAEHKLDADDEGSEQPSPGHGVLMTPEEMVAAMLALGDLFPAEWPQTSTSRRAGALQPPSHMRQRAAIAKSLESCTQQFRDIISFGAASENRMVRAALVRLCSKAAGLGGGMGLFLAQPLLEELMNILKGGTALAEGRRVLEVIVPLAFKPAIKAALLDLKAVSGLAKYLHRLVSTPQQEGAEGQTCITMVLETLTLLCNPDIALNKLAPREQRLVDDCPTLVEASALTAVLLACLPQLIGASNVNMAKNIICAPDMGLASYPAGRLALRQGALKWHSTSLQLPPSQRGEPAAFQAALSWAARKLWEAGERFGEDSESQAIAAACNELSRQLEDVTNKPEEEVEEPPQPAPAHNRFAMAVQAAKTSAGSIPEEEPLSHVREIANSSPLAQLCDAPTQAFWRYARARAGKASLQRKLTKVDASYTDVPPASTMFGEPLTRRKRPREVQKPAGAGGDSSKKGKSEEESRSTLPPIPTVLAPPRRRDLMRGRSSSTSRPASMHVDDYQKKEGKFTGSPAAHNTPPRATPPQPVGPAQTSLPGPPLLNPNMKPPGPLSGPPAFGAGVTPFQSSGPLQGPMRGQPGSFNPPLPQGPPPSGPIIRPLNVQPSSGFQPPSNGPEKPPFQAFSGPSQGFPQQGSKQLGRPGRSPSPPQADRPSPQKPPPPSHRQSPPRGPGGPLTSQTSKSLSPGQSDFNSPRGPSLAPFRPPPPIRPLMPTTNIPPPSHPPPISPPSARGRTSFSDLVASPVSPAEAPRPRGRIPPADSHMPPTTPGSGGKPVRPLDLKALAHSSPPRNDSTPASSGRDGSRSSGQPQRSAWEEPMPLPPPPAAAAAAVDMEYDSLYDNLYEPAATPSGPPSRTTSGGFGGAPLAALGNAGHDGGPSGHFSPSFSLDSSSQPERRPSATLPASIPLLSQPSINNRPTVTAAPSQHTTSPDSDRPPPRPTAANPLSQQSHTIPVGLAARLPSAPHPLPQQPHPTPAAPPSRLGTASGALMQQPLSAPAGPAARLPSAPNPQSQQSHTTPTAPPSRLATASNSLSQQPLGSPPGPTARLPSAPTPVPQQPHTIPAGPTARQLPSAPNPPSQQPLTAPAGPPTRLPSAPLPPSQQPHTTPAGLAARLPSAPIPVSQAQPSTPAGPISRLGSGPPADPAPATVSQQSTSPPAAPRVGGSSAPAAAANTGGPLEQQLQQIIRDPEKLRRLLASQPGLAKLLKDRVARRP